MTRSYIAKHVTRAWREGFAQGGDGGERPRKTHKGPNRPPPHPPLGCIPRSPKQSPAGAAQGAHGGARLRAAPCAAAPPPMRGLWDAMTGAPPAPGLLSLPDDVLVCILRKAAPRPCEARVLFVVPLVCRRLAAVARQPSDLWAEQLITLHRCRPPGTQGFNIMFCLQLSSNLWAEQLIGCTGSARLGSGFKGLRDSCRSRMNEHPVPRHTPAGETHVLVRCCFSVPGG